MLSSRNTRFAAQLKKRHQMTNESDTEEEVDSREGIASSREWRPKLTYAMSPPQSAQETPAINRSGHEAEQTGARMAQKGATRTADVDAYAVASRVYELMREEARLAKLRGAWWKGK